MKNFLVISMLLLTSCANVSTSRFEYAETQGQVTKRVTLEVPKEIDAKGLDFHFNFLTGETSLKAKVWSSRNVQTIIAQGNREQNNLVQVGTVIEKGGKGVAEGVVAGGLKGVIP